MGDRADSCFGTFAGLQLCTQGPVSSLEEKQKDETFARNGDAGGVALVSAASPDPAAEGGKDEVPEKDDDPSAVVALPPLPSDSSDSTQESGQEGSSQLELTQSTLNSQDKSVTLFLISCPGVLEDQELQVQNAIAAAANPPKESSSISSNDNNGSSSEIPSDPAGVPVPVPAPSTEIEPPSAKEISATSEVKAPAFQMTPPIPEVKQTGKWLLFSW